MMRVRLAPSTRVPYVSSEAERRTKYLVGTSCTARPPGSCLPLLASRTRFRPRLVVQPPRFTPEATEKGFASRRRRVSLGCGGV